MKVIHIESGLGNQMLSFCEYLAIKKVNPTDNCYIETITYDIPECNEVICQWNGYELDRIFHLNAPNIRSLFSDEAWEGIMRDIHASQFWLKNWNYPVYIPQALRQAGMNLKNVLGDFEAPGATAKTDLHLPRYKKTFLFQYLNFVRRKILKKTHTVKKSYEGDLFIKSDDDLFAGQQLFFKYKNSGIERIEQEIRKAFAFPAITDSANLRAAKEISSQQSVAIHARRGDMMSFNFDCYYGGYFKRAVQYIKNQVGDPTFYIFCDPGSVDWAKSHSKVLGLDFNRDKIHFINWNSGENSWRDMQLMALCKHQVITRSSFGWWGAFLNTYPNKITCSPESVYNTTHQF